jgi:hypothetical protein
MKKRLKPILAMTESDRNRFFSKIKPGAPDECHEWQAYKNPEGYGIFRAGCYDPMIHAHRVAYMLHYQVELPNSRHGGSKTCVLHTCDNPACCNPAHLWLGSRDDNMKDCAKKGRIISKSTPPVGIGEKNGRALLTEDQVRYIRRTHKNSPHKMAILDVLADQFGISRNSIRDITGRRTWKHVV